MRDLKFFDTHFYKDEVDIDKIAEGNKIAKDKADQNNISSFLRVENKTAGATEEMGEQVKCLLA
jgi:predicted DNA-binding ribbon-helix-helix protein